MPMLRNNTTQVFFHIKSADARIAIAKADDIVEEIDLIGTERSLVPRFGFGSASVEYDIWLTEAEYNKLVTIRAAQSLTNKVVYSGQEWSLTFEGGVRKILHYNYYELTIRLKRI